MYIDFFGLRVSKLYVAYTILIGIALDIVVFCLVLILVLGWCLPLVIFAVAWLLYYVGPVKYVLEHTVTLYEGQLGYLVRAGKPIAMTLYPGSYWMGDGVIKAVSIKPETHSVIQPVILPDGSEVKVTVTYTIQADADRVWLLYHTSDDETLLHILSLKIQNAVRDFCVSTDIGPQNVQEALAGQRDIAAAVLQSVRFDEHGLKCLELGAFVEKSGVMTEEDLRPTLRNQQRGGSEIEKAARRVERLKQLEPLATQLRQTGTPEDEIKRIIESARIRIMDDE